MLMIETLGDSLKYLRLEKNLTQKQLGEKIGICQSAICKWELNLGKPNIYYLVRLAAYFDVSIDYLAGLE